MDDQLIIIFRAWGSTEYNQKFIDEVQHYLSSAQADLDVTTPFDFQESTSSLANRTRIAILLAHELFRNTENKNEFLVGFEAAIFFRVKNELAWSSVGRFAIEKILDKSLHTFVKNGSDLDNEILLPVQLIGVEKEINVSSGSILINDDSKIIVSSVYRSHLALTNSDNPQSLIEVNTNNKGSYWFVLMTQK